MSELVNDQIREIANKYQFNPALVNRFSFLYGFARASSIIKSLTEHTSSLPVRVNTLLTTSKDLVKALNEKEIPARQHPEIEEAVLIDIQGPIEIAEKAKKIVVHKYGAAKASVGGSIGAPGIKEHEDVNIGDEVTLIDRFGSVAANAVVMMSSAEIDNQKRGVALRITASKYIHPNFQNVKEYLRGHFIQQMIPSILIGSQITIKPQARVLDLSVGEGKMLTHVWQRNSKANAKFIAIDHSSTRLQKLDANLKRLRMLNAPFEVKKMKLEKFEKRFNRDETFDYIILHAPNSGIGKRPKISDNTTEGFIFNNARTQKKMMYHAARLLKKDGTIFYSTNSLDPAENERIIEEIVEKRGLSIVEQEKYLGERCMATFQGAEHLQYFFPDKQDTQGFFIAKLTK